MKATKKLLNKRIVFTENPRQIESAVISTVGEELKLELTVAGEKKILFAEYKDWKCNDMYPNDFTKRIFMRYLMRLMKMHCISLWDF